MSEGTLREQAEREFDRRSLEKIAAAIPDPDLRKQAQQLAAGTLSARDAVQGLERSPAAWRGMDRYLNRYMQLSEEDRQAIFDQREAEIGKVVAELSAQQQPPQQPARRAVPKEADEETWENESWLE